MAPGLKLSVAVVLAMIAIPLGGRAQEFGRGIHYTGQDGNTKYVPFDQIDRDNVDQLRVVWRRPAVDPSITNEFPELEPSNSFQSTPLFFEGVLYASNAVGLVEAFDAATGQTLWVQEPVERGFRGVAGRATRGVALWVSPSTGERRVLSARGEYLYALDAETGEMIETFGEQGRINLRRDNPHASSFRAPSGVAVVNDVIVVAGTGGGAGDFDSDREGAPEDVRGFDVRSGELLWTFHVVPRPGEFGNETWEDGSWEVAGAIGAWVPLSVDAELGHVYVPLSAPSPAWYGGYRPGQNLFSNSLVCLDARTGERIWHYQIVHHDLWDYDLPSSPILGDITVDGRQIKAVMQPTKHGLLFTFDRVTGQPVWPIEERPVPASTVPGEVAWPTQPFPTKPAPFDRVGITVDDLIDFTPELRARALEIIELYVLGPVFTPPSLATATSKGTATAPGASGSANWNGGAFDPETGMLYVASHTQVWANDLVPVPPDEGTAVYRHGPPPEQQSGSTGCCSQMELYGPDGLPIVKPPYGRITAIDMNRGEHRWVVPNGDGPRDHPLLRDLDLPSLGASGRGAPLLTKTLLFVGEGDPILVATPQYMGGNGFRAYDKATGAVVWTMEFEAGTTSAPISYMHEGKQYIVVAIGGRDHPAEFVALALSASDDEAGQQASNQVRSERAEEATQSGGVYATAQADRGREIYRAKCESCHQVTLAGSTTASPLVGQSFRADWQGRSLGNLYGRIRTTMPDLDPGSLKAQEVVDLIAYILLRNGYPAGSQELSPDFGKLREMEIQPPTEIGGHAYESDPPSTRWVARLTSEPFSTVRQTIREDQ